MFTGIVRGVGRVLRCVDHGADRQLSIGFDGVDLGPLQPGRSVAVNGVCLTVTACSEDRFDADVSAETLAVTNFSRLAAGGRVNLEPALKVGDSLDGHWVTGHVDCVGHVVALAEEASSLRLRIELPPGFGRYVARKGSITVDGVSLTVNRVDGPFFEVNIVPHTRRQTLISDYGRGSAVNIEVDVLARYVERLGEAEPGGIDRERLQQYGYISEK